MSPDPTSRVNRPDPDPTSRVNRPGPDPTGSTDAPTPGCPEGSVPRDGSQPLEGTHPVKLLGVRRKVLVEGSRDQRVATIATAQRGRVARRQLLAAGVTRNMITTMLDAGSLRRRRIGVYAGGHAAPVELGRETEALLACGDTTLLSAMTAAGFWNMLPELPANEPIDVVVMNGQTAKSRPGIRVHRSRTLTRADFRIHKGLPVTSPARTLLDIAEIAHPRELEIALDEALATKILRLAQLTELLKRSDGRRGAPILRRLLAQRTTSTITHSKANERLFAMIRAAGLPQPETNLKIKRFQADFYWRDADFAVEVDSYQWHSSPFAFKRDLRKNAAFDDAGIQLSRVTWEMMDLEPLAVIARISRKIAEGLAARKAA